MNNVVAAARQVIARPFSVDADAVNCHHNYVQKERHFGSEVFVTRKGALGAHGRAGDHPGSMGARSYIVRGLGNAEAFCSCSHGAGRVMSPNEARRRFTVADQALATAHVECRKDRDVIDEIPMAY
ncbi:RtcB family protein [Accumulibacter sp.]|uniref:RtcB family protein n=1 Tax=Accumulibacter sp. TaxID=2053492 RepID=UPI0025D16FEE|nr:RtcB family protein [Accumulibacter sp.]